MKNLTVELKKCKRTGILVVLPLVGLLGALYAFVNFIVRKEVLLSLPLPPMDVLLTQLYGMVMVLNMFGIIVATTLTYNMEFQGNAIKKMYMLPFKTSSIFKNKFYILFVLLTFCIVLQNGALCIIGNIFLPNGTFELLTLVKYTGYCFVSSLPVLAFMLLVSSRCENIWFTLGMGLNLLLIIPGVLIANTPLWLVYPYCYSGYVVSDALHTVTTTGTGSTISLFPFIPCAVIISALALYVSIKYFGRKEMR